MKKLYFKKLWIVSDNEQSARIEHLDEDEIAVLSNGVNTTGKSSFIKSIYAALGANPSKNNSKWQKLETSLLLEFSIDNKIYYSFRKGNNIGIYDQDKNKIAIHYGVTKSAPTWMKLLGFSVNFPGSRSSTLPAWPSVLFMPFYIDQDTGLSEPWSSFDGYRAFKDAKDTFVDFHTGIRPKEYYESKAKKDAAIGERNVQMAEREHLTFSQRKLNAESLDTDLNFEPEVFKSEIEEFLQKQNRFNKIREDVRIELSVLQSERTRLNQEKTLAASTLKELESDTAYLAKIDTSEIICPTCNTTHETSFAHVLRLSGDTEICRDYLENTVKQLDKLNIKIDKKFSNIDSLNFEFEHISKILSEKRGELTLRSMLEHESKRIAGASLEREKEIIDQIVGKIDERISGAEDEMNFYASKEKKKKILEFYQVKLRAFCSDLGVTAPDNMMKKVRAIVNETGSELPRLILAYHYAILHTVVEFSTAVIAPIVFDTVQHQDQDDDNVNAMIKFAFEKRPANTQLIFASVTLHDYNYSGLKIISDSPRKLLRKSDYISAKKDMLPFLQQMLEARTNL